SDTRKKRKDPDSDDWSESNSKENKIDNKHLNLLSSDSEIEQDYQKAKKRKTSDL
nr:Chain A, Inner nuclear membrane protein SRC1 [Saccharomyces cerevisiae S288C]